MSELNQKGFTINWKIENVNFCRAHKDWLISPKFVAATLQNTEWKLRLDISRRNMDIDSLRITLKRLDGIPNAVLVNIDMLIVRHGRLEFVGSMKHTSFSKDEERSFSTKCLNSEISELCLDNMLTFSCHIFIPSIKSVISEKCIAQTRVGVEKICCPWRIENFSTRKPVVVSLYSSMSKSAHHLECKGVTWLTNDLLTIEIGRKQQENDLLLKVIGKISVLNLEGTTKFSAEDKYSFSTNVDTWNFQIPANKSTLLRECKVQESGDKLLMLCDFTFFTEVTTEIIGYVWLPPAFQSVVEIENKKENLTPKTENLDATEKEKIVFTPNHKMAYPVNNVDSQSLLKEDFLNLYKQRIQSDVVLCAEKRSIPCHKAILCARSPVFKVMFDNQMRETLDRKVQIPDLDDDTLHQFLLYVYSETLEHMDWVTAKKLMYAADKYEIKSLMRDCSSFLSSHLTTSNVCEALEFADMHQEDSLKTACQNLIFKHATEIFASKAWKDFTVKQPLLSAETFQKYFASKN